MTEHTTPLLRVRGLTTAITTRPQAAPAVADVSFDLRPGEILGIVGESGSGKTLTVLSAVRMLPDAAQVTGGEVWFGDQNLRQCNDKQMRAIRGRRIGMIFQDPLAYLNPRMTIGNQITECLLVHGAGAATAKARTVELLELVGIDDAAKRVQDYPHQFSGGMRQRVLIAMAIANDPELLIADEPTTALDVTVQNEILELLVELRDKLNIGIVIITHDMSIVRQVCDTTMVMYGGRVIERGPTHGTAAEPGIMARPRHPYTQALLDAVPDLDAPVGRMRTIPGTPPDLGQMPPGCPFAPRCSHRQDDCEPSPPELRADVPGRELACLHPIVHPEAASPREESQSTVVKTTADPVLTVDHVTFRYPGTTGRRHRSLRPALDDVSLAISPGEIVGIIGESGSGKSTLARVMLGLARPQQGRVAVNGTEWTVRSRQHYTQLRQTVQMIFQDPYLSLNPRQTIRSIISEPLGVHDVQTGPDPHAYLEHLMTRVGLPVALLDRLPHQLSGGQRQRVGIARALAVEPSIVVADEPVSALDVSVQAQIVNLLADLRNDLGVGIAFIAHDLGLVRQSTDRTVVMYQGSIVEHGYTDELFADPRHAYTQRLIASTQFDLRAAS